jgi:hypothetical protein
VNLLIVSVMILLIMNKQLRAKGILLLLPFVLFQSIVHAANGTENVFDPKKARVIIVCLAQYAANANLNNFSTDDRLDTAFVNQLITKGVPKDKITFLKDKEATLANIQTKVKEALSQSTPDETLIFYIGSHGGYDATKQQWNYYTYEEGKLNFSWILQALNTYFKGQKALLFSDSCYSGGMIELAQKQKPKMQLAILSSAYQHNIAYSGWRFIDVLMRAFNGDAVVDVNQSGVITIDDLFHYARKHMEFVAEGMPQFWLSEGFSPQYELAAIGQPSANQQIGQYEEVFQDKKWKKAEILDIKNNQHYVHFTDNADKAWVNVDSTRAFQYPVFAIGDKVSVQGKNSKGEWLWYPATVSARDGWMYLIHYKDYDAIYDEWVGPSRINAVK